MAYDISAPIDTSRLDAIATGHGATMERWEDTPTGRRSSGQPLIDEATGAPVRIYDVMLPTGRDGRHELHGIRVVSHEVPELAPYSPVELDGLWVRVKPARNGGKGVEVSFSAEAIRPVAGPQRPNRRAAEGEAA
ncbi:hypothetical protein [Actinomycetospora straminea]|uniref:Uncharacterized protein n=1 Tax=Actinomycetospora straminea TaxID=663607 RepID=A0ABP9EE65_9PSEU|nr:hypothetical protein [Actinomycetospora straminea]MDD7931919.1 hypothetical protein [Actinomycetospora straminea]